MKEKPKPPKSTTLREGCMTKLLKIAAVIIVAFAWLEACGEYEGYKEVEIPSHVRRSVERTVRPVLTAAQKKADEIIKMRNAHRTTTGHNY